MKTIIPIKVVMVLFFILTSNISNIDAQVLRPLTPRAGGTQNRIKGDLVMAGNGIIGLVSENGNNYNPNAAYNGTLSNGNSISDYIDIDGDATTFSSSSADIITPRPGCTRIVYAGLYWSATYYLVRNSDGDVNNPVPNTVNNNGTNARLGGLPAQDARKVGAADFRNIRFRVPFGTYVGVTAQSIIYDGYRNTLTNPSNTASDDVPYVCYADVTNLIDQSNPTGTYTVADMNATIGRTSGVDGASGGWVLVVIYADPEESSKFISTNDGLVQITSGSGAINYTYTGFQTLPAPLPVNVRYGTATLEGDYGLGGDQLRLQNTAGNFVRLGTTTGRTNRTRNFFDSSISFNHISMPFRNPNSINTLGFDVDLFDLPNAGRNLIGNNQTSATFRLSTNQDVYRVFLNTFSVEIIEPELRVLKRVFDTDGVTDITNANVELGAELYYDLEIENVGNEDLVPGSVRVVDNIPVNMDLVGVQDATLPPGVTYSTLSPGVLEFLIPADLVEQTDGPISIRFRARLVNSCEALRDACSNRIQNSALAFYTGILSNAPGTNNSSSVLGACGDTDGEATNFLVNVPACSRDVSFCGGNLQLQAGTGYDRYTWTGPGIVTPIVQENSAIAHVLNVANAQSGTYHVVKEDTDPSDGTCMTLSEDFVVANFGDIDNPILDYVNGTTVVTENCSGLDIPQISLCGNQSMLLQTNFLASSLVSISWQRLSPGGSCISDPNDPCSLLSANCTGANWIEEPGGNTADFTVSVAGDYKIVAEFDGGCVIPFYFSVFKNDYQPLLTMNPIECGNDGSVTVTNAPNNYAFSLISGGPYTNTTGIFAVAAPGDVTVYAIDTIFPGCEYTATINVPEINPIFTVTGTNPTCINDDNGTGSGTIQIIVTNGSPEYQYTINAPSLAAPIVVPNSSANNGNYIQNGLLPDTYTVEVISNRPNHAPNCIYDATVTITAAPDFRAEVVLIAPETCDTGAIVQVNVLAGSGNYLYGDGTGNFVANNQFEIPIAANPATIYTFYVSDQNIAVGVPACVISASIDNITPYVPIVIDNVTVTNPACPADGGQIRVEVSPTVAGRVYTYELLDNTNTVVDQINSPLRDVTFVNIADGPSYTVRVSHNNTTPPGTTPPSICPVEMGTYSITSPTLGAVTASETQEYRCDAAGTGIQTATITVAPLLGAGYFYSIDGVDYTNTTGIFTGLVDGTYTVYARTAATVACPISSLPIVIDPLQEVSALTFTQTALTCPALESTIVVAATGTNGASSFEYRIATLPAAQPGYDVFSSNDTYTLDPGTYTFEARTTVDGCIYSDTVTINPIDNITVIGTPTAEPICNGGTEGALSFTVGSINLATNTYEYSVSGGSLGVPTTATVQNSPTINIPGLEAGTYTVLVRDEITNCSATVDIIIADPAVLDFTFTTDDADCGNNTGIITVTATGGRAAYQYELRDSGAAVITAYQGSNIFNGLAPDTYTVFVRDGNNAATACVVSKPVTIAQTQLPVLATVAGGDACYDTTNQASQWITITPGTAPVGPFTYSLNGAADQPVVFLGAPANTFEILNLTPGTHTVTVTNTASICASAPILFTIAPQLTISASLTKEITCAPTPDATIAYTTTGGNGTNTFEIIRDGAVVDPAYVGGSPYSTSIAGTYEIRVTDAESCQATSNPIIVAPYVPVAANATPTDPFCPGGVGSILVNVTAGSGPYTYVLDGGATTVGPIAATTHTFTNVAIGAHTITVSDQYGCVLSPALNVSITAPPALTATIAVTTDYSCDAAGTGIILGEITVSAPLNGNGSYEYSIDGVDFSNTTGVFVGLTDGTYTLYIRDTNTSACPVNLGPLTIAPLQRVDDLTFAQTQVQCAALTSDITVTATGTNGAVSFEYRIAAPAGDVTSFSGTTLYTLAAGVTYTFEARTTTDGCVYSEDYTIPNIDFIAVNGTVTAEPTCSGDPDGSLSFNVTNIDLVTNTYSYTVTGGTIVGSITGGPINTTPTPIVGLGAGSYVVEVTDTATNCTATDTVVISDPTAITVTATPELANCSMSTGIVTVTASGGRGAYQYELRDAAGIVVVRPYQASNIFSGLASGTYTVFVRDGSLPTACETPATPVIIDVVAPPTIVTALGGDVCYDTTNQASQWITITLGVLAPVGPFEYSVDGGVPVPVVFLPGPAPANTFEIPNLIPGTYNVTVRNTGSNCSSVAIPFTIEPQVTISAALTKDIDCSATPDGIIEITTANGNGARTIEVSYNAGAYVAAISPYAAVNPGTYQFRVTDSEGCTADSAIIDVTISAAPTLTAPDVIVLCDGDTGTISITVDGTFGPYLIDFNGTGSVVMTGSTMQFPNLGEGNYPYVITDNKLCTYPDDVDVIAPDPITEASRIETPITCGGSVIVTDLGAIDFTINDRGALSYTYTLIEASNLFTVPLVPAATAATTPNPTTIVNNTIRFEGLDFGQYYIVVEDVNGCTETFGTFDIFSPPNDLVQLITPSATCPGGVTFDIDVQGGSGIIPPANPPPGFDIRIVGELGPNGIFQPLNDLPLPATVVDANTPIRKHQYTNLEFNRTYILEVRDNATSCLYQEIVAPVPPPSSPNVINDVVTNVSCNVIPAVNDGEVSFDISGYDPTVTQVSWEVFDAVTNVTLGVAYTGSAAGLVGADVPVTISNFPPGQYYVVVREDDGTLCPGRYDFTIDIPDPLTATAGTVIPANCNANAQVVISTTGGTPFAIPPTTDGYTYALVASGAGDPGVYPLNSNTIDIGNTNAQIQDVWVADLNGCAFGPISVTTIVTPDPQVAVPPFVDDSCTFDNDYTFTVIGSDGLVNAAGNYFYGIDDANNAGDTPVFYEDGVSHTFTVTTVGTYNITIRDANGCTDVETITVFPELLASADFTTEPTCRNLDGEITTIVTGGSDFGVNPGNFSFTLIENGTNIVIAGPQASNIFAGVAAGDYRVEVTDAAIAPAPGCTVNANVSRPIPVDPIVTLTKEDVSCVGSNDGYLLASIQAGTDIDVSFTYQLFDYPGAVQGVQIGVDQIDDPLFDNLSAGEYLVIVTSAKGCAGQVSETIGSPTQVTAIATQNTYTCAADNSEIFPDITVTIENGTPPYTISYTGPGITVTNQSVTDADIVTPGVQYIIDADVVGNYDITVNDNNSCPVVVPTEVITPFPVMSNPTVVRDVAAVNLGVISCDNPETVIVSIDRILGNTLGYQFDLLPLGTSTQTIAEDPSGTTSATFTLPAPGSYTFRITDLDTGCFIDTAPYDVAPFDTIAVTATEVTPVLCAGAPTGEININVTGYTGAYNYEVTNTGTGAIVIPSTLANTTTNPQLISGLPGGTFTVAVEALGTPFCDEVSNTVTITQPTPLMLAMTSASTPNCNDLLSHVVMNTGGGVGPYNYAYIAGVLPQPDPILFPESETFDLDPAVSLNWVVFVRDTNNCIERIQIAIPAATINPVLDPLPAFVDDSCTFDNSYTFTVTATGFGQLTYQLDADAAVIGNVNNNTHQFTVTAAGTYQVTVYDANGCPSNQETIIVYPELLVSADFTTEPTCRNADGEITATVSGGSDFGVNPGNFSFTLIENITNVVIAGPQGSNIFPGVAAGDYRVEVTDSAIAPVPGCIVSGNVSRDIPVDPILTTTIEDVSCLGSSDGSILVSIQAGTAIDTPFTYTLYLDDSLPGVTGPAVATQTSDPLFTGLLAGLYETVVTSALGCTTNINGITVGSPLALDATTTQSPYACDPMNNDVYPDITVDINDGTAPYRISYTSPSGPVSNVAVTGSQYIIDADVAGPYDITILDANDCSFVIPTETVNPFPIMTNPTATLVTRINCNAPNVEEVTVSVDGGSNPGNFLFEVTGPGAPIASQTIPSGGATTSATFLLPTVGNYSFTITDQTTTCTIPVDYRVDEFDLISMVATQQTPESCLGAADGEINISITGYSGPYSFSVLDSAGTPIVGAVGTGNTTTDPDPYTLPVVLPQGSYIVEVTETATPFCIERSNVVSIMGPTTAITVDTTPVVSIESCSPGSDGSFQAYTSGAQGAVVYTIAPVVGTTNGNGLFEGLPANTYTITATDANGCTDTTTADIIAPTAFTPIGIATTDITCFGDRNGSITATAGGGQGPGTYLYTLTYPDGVTTSGPQSSNVFNNLAAGVNYIVTVSDNLNCTINSASITIAEPTEVIVNEPTVVDINCGDTTGDVVITGNTSDPGGIVTYIAVRQDVNPTTMITQPNGNFTLVPGQYQFYVIDANGCRSQLSRMVPIILIQDIGLTLDTTFAMVNCFGEATARVDAAVSGGFGDYTFILTGINGTVYGPTTQSNSDFSDLAAGEYQYDVTTARGCSARDTFVVTQPTELDVPVPILTPISCNGEDDGSIRIVVTPGTGTPGYSFAITPNVGTFFNDASDGIPNEHTFTDLPAGTYTVVAQDANGCDVVHDTLIIVEPSILQASIVGAVTPETCAGDSDGAVTISITGGTPDYQTSITNNDADFVTGLLTYDNLPGGTTIIFIRDANNCMIELSVNIPPGVSLQASIETRLECPIRNPEDPAVITQEERYFVDFIPSATSVTNDVRFVLTGINGTTQTYDEFWYDNGTGRISTEVVPGTYEATMEHVGGCSQPLGVIVVEEYTPLSVPVAQTTNNSADPNEYEIIVSGGEAPYTYYVLFDSAEGELESNVFVVRKTGTYLLRVVDANGCEVMVFQDLTYINIRIPNYFTPDKTNVPNEEKYWYPRQIVPDLNDPNYYFDNMEVKVFDRYGRLLSEFKGDELGWDGKYQGKELPSGDYWYSIILNDVENKQFTGHFTLYR